MASNPPGTIFFSSARTYDGAGNVTGVNTGLPAGGDNQAFCYDEQNRLVWAGDTSAAKLHESDALTGEHVELYREVVGDLLTLRWG